MDSTLDREQRQFAWTQAARDADVAERAAAHDAMRRPTLDDAEQQGRDRRDAARTASETRRLARRAVREEHRRDCFYVCGPEGEHVTSFAIGAPGHATLEGVVADLVEKFHGDEGVGFGSKDMVVWHEGRLVAIIRRGEDGQPVAMTLGP